MSRIYRTTDRLEVNIHDITVKIAPLSLHQKSQIQSMMLDGQKKNDLQMLNKAIMQAIKFCLKDIKGLEDASGNPYMLSFENNELTDECLEDLTNMEHSADLVKVCSAFVSGIPRSFEIEGVSFANTEKK